MPLSKMLLPVALEPRDAKMLAYACGLLEQGVHELLVAHVVDSSGQEAPVILHEVERVRERLREMVEPYVHCGMNIEVRVATGNVFREVMCACAQVNVDVLLCGTEGKSFVDYLFSGSVSEDLALKGEGRTMTVRYDLLDASDDAGRLGREFAHRLVIPTDFSSSSMRALLSAFARPAEALGTLHILHVLAEGEGRADAEAHMRALTALAEEHRTDFVAEIRAGEIAPDGPRLPGGSGCDRHHHGPARDEPAGPRASRQRLDAPAARRALSRCDPTLDTRAFDKGEPMPRRADINKILVIGSGPIVIGQACEFDYSGAQACKVLERGRLRGRARQQQPGHDHDRPGPRQPHLRRADHARVRREGHRRPSDPTRCCRRSAGRPA